MLSNMAKIYCLIVFVIGLNLQAQNVIPLDSVIQYEGQTVTICAKVQGTFKTKNNTIMLNFGKPYPEQTFTVVIFAQNLTNFSYVPETFLKNKEICVTGKVKLYKGSPEIIVKKEEEIQLK